MFLLELKSASHINIWNHYSPKAVDLTHIYNIPYDLASYSAKNYNQPPPHDLENLLITVKIQEAPCENQMHASSVNTVKYTVLP